MNHLGYQCSLNGTPEEATKEMAKTIIVENLLLQIKLFNVKEYNK
tara:strand:- start:1768 stop:1902 length:135 start_codon:yes stop_codon:yes gene_type:complete